MVDDLDPRASEIYSPPQGDKPHPHAVWNPLLARWETGMGAYKGPEDHVLNCGCPECAAQKGGVMIEEGIQWPEEPLDTGTAPSGEQPVLCDGLGWRVESVAAHGDESSPCIGGDVHKRKRRCSGCANCHKPPRVMLPDSEDPFGLHNAVREVDNAFDAPPTDTITASDVARVGKLMREAPQQCFADEPLDLNAMQRLVRLEALFLHYMSNPLQTTPSVPVTAKDEQIRSLTNTLEHARRELQDARRERDDMIETAANRQLVIDALHNEKMRLEKENATLRKINGQLGASGQKAIEAAVDSALRWAAFTYEGVAFESVESLLARARKELPCFNPNVEMQG